MQNGSNGEYVEGEVLYKYRRKLMMKLKQVRYRQKKIQKNGKLLLLHVQPILLFHQSLECSGGPKHLLLRNGNPVYNMMEKYVVKFRRIPTLYQQENGGINPH